MANCPNAHSAASKRAPEEVLREVVAYEAEVIQAHLGYASMPKTLRERLERQRVRLLSLSGPAWESYWSVLYDGKVRAK